MLEVLREVVGPLVTAGETVVVMPTIPENPNMLVTATLQFSEEPAGMAMVSGLRERLKPDKLIVTKAECAGAPVAVPVTLML
jgi:hypothetical protein